MKLKDRFVSFFRRKLDFKLTYNEVENLVTIKCNKNHNFKKNKVYHLKINDKIVPFKVKSVIDKKTVTSKYFTPALYVWTTELFQDNNIYKVGITNWQTVFERVNQQDTTGVPYKPRIVDYWLLDVDTPIEAEKIEKTVHSRLNLIRNSREFVENDYKTEVKPTILDVIKEFNANKIKPDSPTIFPRYYQYIRKELAIKYYTNNNIGWFQSACGTGKSYDGFWIYDALNTNEIFINSNGIVILFVPSLQLLEQTVGDLSMLFDMYSYKLRTIKISSENGNTTNENDLVSFIKESDNKNNSVNLIACTYQSYKVVQNSLAITNTIVDFTIYDEVHKLAGFLDKSFLQSIKDSVIPSQKKVSMTASPIFYMNNGIGVAGMNNKQMFGKGFHTYSTSDGIEDGYLTPLRVVALDIEEESINYVAELINENNRLSTVELFNDDEFGYASFIVQLICALEAFKQGLWTHPIYYSNTIARAEKFNECLEYLAPIFGVKLDYIKVLQGSDSAKTRNTELQYKFTKSKIGLVSNSRCLNEGISVKCVDGIGFIDPRDSMVDITQILGRPMRLYDGKGESVIIIPVVYKNGKIKSDYWKETLNIVLNLVASNDEIENILSSGEVDIVKNVNIRKNIDLTVAIPKQKTKNKSGGNKKSLDKKKKTEPFYISNSELLSLKFKDIVKGYRSKPRSTNNNIVKKIRKYDYYAKYENGIEVSLREFDVKVIKKYSQYIKTNEWHIENYSKLNNMPLEQAKNELEDFFKRIEKKQKTLFDKIYEVI